MTNGDRAVGEPERLHPLFLLTGIGAAMRRIAGAYALIAYFAVSGRLLLGLTMLAGLLLFAILSVFLYWRRFEFRVGADEIRIDSGVLNRTHRSIPFDRVQDVDITQGLVARLLGLARITFETGAGSARPGSEEGVLQVVRLDRAEQLRELVRARRSGSAAAAAEPHEAEATPIYRMDLKRLLLAGAFNFSLALFAGLFGLTQTVGQIVGFDPFSRSFWGRVLSAGDPLQSYILTHRAFAAVAGALLLIFIGVITGATRTIQRDYGFRLDRTGVGLRRRRGLFTRTDVTLPARRAQAAIIVSGPAREMFGFGEFRVQSLAHDDDKSGNHVLAPLATSDEAGSILAELGWRPLSNGAEWQRVSPAYVLTLLVGLVPLYLLLAGEALMIGFAWRSVGADVRAIVMRELTPLILLFAVTLGGVVLAPVTRWLAWRLTRYALDGDRLLVRTGWWRRRTTILPLGKIQSIDLKESVVSRWFGTASLQFGVAGGTALVAHSIPAIPRERARQLRDQLLGLRP
jgi:putative membrane protein